MCLQIACKHHPRHCRHTIGCDADTEDGVDAESKSLHVHEGMVRDFLVVLVVDDGSHNFSDHIHNQYGNGRADQINEQDAAPTGSVGLVDCSEPIHRAKIQKSLKGPWP